MKEDAAAREGRKVAIHCVFSNDLWLWRVEKQACQSGGCGAIWMRDGKLHAAVTRSTFGSEKAEDTSRPLAVEISKKCASLWREARFDFNMVQAHTGTTCSDHFWTLTCRKNARPCGGGRTDRQTDRGIYQQTDRQIDNYNSTKLRFTYKYHYHYHYHYNFDFNHNYHYNYNYIYTTLQLQLLQIKLQLQLPLQLKLPLKLQLQLRYNYS